MEAECQLETIPVSMHNGCRKQLMDDVHKRKPQVNGGDPATGHTPCIYLQKMISFESNFPWACNKFVNEGYPPTIFVMLLDHKTPLSLTVYSTTSGHFQMWAFFVVCTKTNKISKFCFSIFFARFGLFFAYLALTKFRVTGIGQRIYSIVIQM